MENVENTIRTLKNDFQALQNEHLRLISLLDRQRGQIDAFVGIFASLIFGHPSRQNILNGLRDQLNQVTCQSQQSARAMGVASVARSLLETVEKLCMICPLSSRDLQ